MEQEITMAAIHEAEQQQDAYLLVVVTHHQKQKSGIGHGKNDPDDGQTRGGGVAI